MERTKSARKTSKEAKTPEQTSGRKTKKAISSSAVEKSTFKKTTVKSPAKDEERDGLSSANSSTKSKRRKKDDSSSLDLEVELDETAGSSMDVSDRHQRESSTESSSEEEGNVARRNLRLAKSGVAFASPSTSSRQKGLLSGPLQTGRTTSSTDQSDQDEEKTESTDDLQGSEEGEVVEKSNRKKKGKKRKRKTSKEASKTAKVATKTSKEAARELASSASGSCESSESEEGDYGNAEALNGDPSSDDDDGSVDTMELLRRCGHQEDEESSSSSDSEDSDDSETGPRRLRGAFKFTPQEVYDRLKGDEDPQRMGWDRKFLTTPVDTPTGRMSFITALEAKKKVWQWSRAKERMDHKGENSYVQHLHITQNQGYNATMLTELSYKAFKKLQTEWGIAEAVTPGQVDWAGLIPSSPPSGRWHRNESHIVPSTLLISALAKSQTKTKLDGMEGTNFFDRVLRVYPHPTVSRDSAIYTQLKSAELVYDKADNFASVSDWFRLLNTIMGSYDLSGINEQEVVDIIFRKLKSMGPGAYHLYTKLKAQQSEGFRRLMG